MINAGSELLRLTHQRLVKTTPKPRATKKSNGELVGLLLLVWLVAAGGTLEVDDAAIVAHLISSNSNPGGR